MGKITVKEVFQRLLHLAFKLFLFVDSDSFGQEINRDEYCRNVKVDFAKKWLLILLKTTSGMI